MPFDVFSSGTKRCLLTGMHIDKPVSHQTKNTSSCLSLKIAPGAREIVWREIAFLMIKFKNGHFTDILKK